MSTQDPPPVAPARSFGGVADAYDRGRPGYPREVAAWLTGDVPTAPGQPLRVLELGAGTGKLTRELVALGHQVHATDPDPQMLTVLQRDLPEVRTSQAPAEDLPAGDGAYDVVVSAQAFHWFDPARALPEISRVLRPGGRLALVWNQRDERIPWVRRLGRIIGAQDQLRDPAAALADAGLFDEVETARFGFWQAVDRRSIQDLVLSRSAVAVLGEAGRQAKLAEVLALYDDYGRGMDGMQLPYVARCFRAAALDRVTPHLTSTGSLTPTDPDADGHDGHDRQHDRQDDAPDAAVSDGSSTDLLLIDFR